MSVDTVFKQLKREDKPDLVYEMIEGRGLVTVMFLGGFRSDMMGTKAEFLKDKCQSLDCPYVRFDYRGHGQSDGEFKESCISEWTEDATDILNHVVRGDVLLVGSSMGGWISLLLALQNSKRIHGLIGLAAAPDFTQWMKKKMNDVQRQQLMVQGYFELSNDYDDPYVITQKLLDDGQQNSLLSVPLDIQCPVRLIQGMKDDAVDWRVAKQIQDVITGQDVEVILLNEADHRLSAPDELDVLYEQVKVLVT